MAPWYEEAEFYHIYPIGLTGAPRKNESEETVHRFSTDRKSTRLNSSH